MPQMPAGPKTIYLNGVIVGKVMGTGDTEEDAEVMIQFLKDKGLHKETSPFQAIQNQAYAFANTAAYLYTRDLTKVPRKGVSAVPFVVNAAFAIELYFKALAQKHGVKLTGHELLKLYAAQPSKALSEIASVIPRCADNRGLGKDADFPGYLAGLNNTFVEWRYLHEKRKSGAIQIQPV